MSIIPSLERRLPQPAPNLIVGTFGHFVREDLRRGSARCDVAAATEVLSKRLAHIAERLQTAADDGVTSDQT